jgi:hypothetical protein
MPNGCRVRILCDTERHQVGEEFNLPTALARKLVERGTAEFVNEVNNSLTAD